MNNNLHSDRPTAVENWLERFRSIVQVSRLRRGQLLYEQGRVLQYAKTNQGFTAKIQGSRRFPYEIDADFSSDENGLPDLDDFYIECSCPDWVEYCKHSICAVLFFSDEMSRELTRFEAESPIQNDKLKRDRLIKLTAMSEYDIYSLPTAAFWKSEQDLPLALRKMHKTVKKKLNNHRYIP